jgi:drug/metabolite transporter (DMT)-like permease
MEWERLSDAESPSSASVLFSVGMTTPDAPGPDRVTALAFGGVVIFGGLNAIAVRQTVLELDPLWGAALRFVAAGLIFGGLTVVRARSFPTGRSLSGAVLYGTVGFALAFGLIYPALRVVQAGTASVVIAMSPLATYGLAVLQRQERFQSRALIGALIALAGIGIVFVEQLGAAVPLGPLALVFVGTLGLSEAGLIAKWMPRADPLATNAVAMTTAGIELLVASLVLGETQAIPVRATTWIALGYITVFGSVAMFGLYLVGLSRWTASGMSYSTLMLPFVSVTVATLLTGEDFSVAFVIGGLVMLVGVYLGAFGVGRPHRSNATSMPECLPVSDCPDATPLRMAPAEQR